MELEYLLVVFSVISFLSCQENIVETNPLPTIDLVELKNQLIEERTLMIEEFNEVHGVAQENTIYSGNQVSISNNLTSGTTFEQTWGEPIPNTGVLFNLPEDEPIFIEPLYLETIDSIAFFLGSWEEDDNTHYRIIERSIELSDITFDNTPIPSPVTTTEIQVFIIAPSCTPTLESVYNSSTCTWTHTMTSCDGTLPYTWDTELGCTDNGPPDGGGGGTGGETVDPECINGNTDFGDTEQPFDDEPDCVDDDDNIYCAFYNFGCCRTNPLEDCPIDAIKYTYVEINLLTGGDPSYDKKITDAELDFLNANSAVIETLGNFFQAHDPCQTDPFVVGICEETNPDIVDAAIEYLQCMMNNEADCIEILNYPDCNLDPAEFDTLFPLATDATRDTLIKYMNKYGREFGINTTTEMRHFLAQTGVESEYYTDFEEDLGYSAAGLVDTWPDHFSLSPDHLTKRYAYDYDFDPEALANFIYSTDGIYEGDTRWCMNGDEDSGDGWRYRGRGIKQLTNGCNYWALHSFMRDRALANNQDTLNIYGNPDLIGHTSVDSLSVLSALWYFQENVLVTNDLPNNATVRTITYAINGGYNGLTNRLNTYNTATTITNCYSQ